MADKKISQLTAASTPLAGTEVLPIVQSSATVKVATDDLTVKNFRSNATTGILQVAGPGASTTRVMTVPNANFTAARTDAAQTFSGLQTFGSGVSVTSGKVTSVYGAGGDFVALFQNTTSATPYGVWIKDAATPTAGYPLLNISDDAGTTIYFRVDSSNGNATLGIGNLVQGTAAKGVNFTANTPAAGMTSQLLNWYEEGTWTPVLSDGTNNATMHASTAGSYTRIGNTVFYRARVRVSSLGSVTGAVRVTGLPFTAANNNSNYGGSTIGVGTGLNITAGYAVSHLIVVGTSYLSLYVWDTAAGSTALDATEFSATGDIYFSGQYYV